MCNLSDAFEEQNQKTYHGKVKKVSYNYDTKEFKRISAEIFFERGSVFIQTDKALNIAPNDRIHFTAELFDGMADNGDYLQEWWIVDLLNVSRPQKKKLTRAEKQRSRLNEAIG